MSELKFSCAHCGQHIACDEEGSGGQIECPAYQGALVVPGNPRPASTGAARRLLSNTMKRLIAKTILILTLASVTVVSTGCMAGSGLPHSTPEVRLP
jgi:hypothetical protein